MFKWKRLVALGTAATAAADTTETQVATGVAVPTWAKSVVQASFTVLYEALTTAENVSGYFRVYDDSNVIDPLNYPLPTVGAQILAATAAHLSSPVSVPIFQNVEPNNIIRVAAAFDVATTGVHKFDACLLFSDQPVPMRLHSQKCALTAMADDLTEGTIVDISTLANAGAVRKTSEILGFWGYAVTTGTMTAGESTHAVLKVKSNLAGFQEQELPLNLEGSAAGGDSYCYTKPVVFLPYRSPLRELFDGFHLRCMGNSGITCDGKETFTLSAYHTLDPNAANDAQMRAGIIWRE